MNPSHNCNEQTGGQSNSTGSSSFDSCNMSISAIISTSCVVLEDIRTSCDDIVPSHFPIYSTSDMYGCSHVPLGDIQSMSPAYNQNLASFGEVDDIDGTRMHSGTSTLLECGNHVFESAATEFTSPAAEMGGNLLMIYKGNSSLQEELSRGGNNLLLNSAPRHRNSSSIMYNHGTSQEFGTSAYKDSVGLSTCSHEFGMSLHVLQGTNTFGDKNLSAGRRSLMQEPITMPLTDNVSPCDSSNERDEYLLDKHSRLSPASGYGDQCQTLSSQSDSRYEFPNKHYIQESDLPPSNEFDYSASRKHIFSRQTDMPEMYKRTSLSVLNSQNCTDGAGSRDCCLSGNDNHTGHFSRNILTGQDGGQEETTACFYMENTEDTLNSYNAQCNFLETDSTTDSCLTGREEIEFSTLSEKEKVVSRSSTSVNVQSDRSIGAATRDVENSITMNTRMPTGTIGRGKRTQAETIESLQQQLEMLEDRRKKMALSCSSMTFLRLHDSADGEKSGRGESGQDGVDVDHMICSGVTVAGFKPRAIIRKRSKTATPNDVKNTDYWQKRRKNNDSARKSRETKKEKEKIFYKRALELEYENLYLQECLSLAEAELATLGHTFVPPVFANECYV